ncbi:MAG: YceI family protein [Mycobacterium sp.]
MTTDRTSMTVSTPLPGTYRLDPDSTTIKFAVRKLGLFTIRGTMHLLDGEFTAADPIEASTVRAVVAADSFKTPVDRRDNHVKSEAFLDSANHPTFEFTGNRVVRSGSGWTVSGTLAIHNRRKDATLLIEELSEDGGTVRVRATAQVDRTDFGVAAMKMVIGPKIDLTIDAVASRV